ncbi:hypothetical protein RB213_011239 [Colletotrichum asianum]
MPVGHFAPETPKTANSISAAVPSPHRAKAFATSKGQQPRCTYTFTHHRTFTRRQQAVEVTLGSSHFDDLRSLRGRLSLSAPRQAV